MSEFWTWAILILGPVVLRKATSWTLSPKSVPGAPRGPVRVSPLIAPYETLVFASVALVVLATVVNLIPARYGFHFELPLHLGHLGGSDTLTVPLSLRGGYRSDLFLLLNVPITVATTTLRSLLTTPAGRAAFVGSEADLEVLLARLSSYAGRKLYLVTGDAALTRCAFCVAPSDYAFYALPRLLLGYAWRAALLVLATAAPRDPLTLTINAIPAILRARQVPGLHHLDRSRWRKPVLAILALMLAFEALVVYDQAQVRVGLGRWNHWNANLHLARSVLFALLAVGVYLLPSHTQPTETEAIQAVLERTLLQLDVHAALTDAVWHDSELRSATKAAYASQPNHPDRIIAAAAKAGIDTSALRAACRAVTATALDDI